MNSIQIKKEFPAALADVFDLMSKHATYNIAFAPMQVERIQDSSDPEHLDGLGSIRAIGMGPFKPLKEQISLFEPNTRIEYQIIKNPLIKHHLGIIEFEALTEEKTLVTYTIELQTQASFANKLILARLQTAIKLGLTKLAKSV